MCKCKKIDFTELISGVVVNNCKSVDCCIKKSKTICKKINSCIQQQNIDFCANPKFLFKCIPFSAATCQSLATMMTLFGKDVETQLNLCSTILFEAVKTGDYTQLSAFIQPTNLILYIYDYNQLLLYTNGTPKALPSIALSAITDPWLLQMNYGSYPSTCVSLTEQYNNLFESNNDLSVLSVITAVPTEFTSMEPSATTTITVGNCYIYVEKEN